MNFFAPNRPNSALDPFMRYMLREVAAGVGVSYESLSRDYSQSNYSSSRLALLDDRDLWRMLQLWFIRSFRMECHREWLQQAVLARALPSISVEQYAADPLKFEAVRFKPRGWSWIDPQKEADARKTAVRAGFDTITNVIAETANGRDLEDVLRERRRELDLAAKFNLDFDTDVIAGAPAATGPTPAADPQSEDTGPQARVARLLGNALMKAELDGEARGREDVTAEAIASIARAVDEHSSVINIAPPAITVESPIVNVEAAKAAVVNVAPPNVTIEPTVVNVAAPVVNVEAARVPEVNVAAPIVNVAAPNVSMEPAQITLAPPAGKSVRTVTEWTDDGMPKTVEETIGYNSRKRVRTVTAWTEDGLPQTVEESDG
jgi:hypothetical protein